MICGQCRAIERQFDRRVAARQLKKYRRKGPASPTQMLIDALRAEGIQGATLLDIGGGVGAIQHELLRAGAATATSVEASAAYIEAAREGADGQGHDDRVAYYHGDFVELAPQIESADIVTLDRVICCYGDLESLVGLSSARARKLYGLVYPRETWWVKLGVALINLGCRLRWQAFRVFVHPAEAVEAIVRSHGLERRFYRQTFIWQVVVYGLAGAQTR